MKELELLKERLHQASSLLPWWANLILAEVSFVTLYLLKSGLLWMVLVSSFFVAASIVANFEAEKRQEIQPENFSKTVIIGVIVATMIISTAIIVQVSSSRAKEKAQLASSTDPKPEKKRHVSAPPRPMITAKPEPQQAAFKTSPTGEKILSYRVSMQDGRDLDCKDVARTADEMFLLKCEKLSGAVHISRIKDMEMRTEIPNGSRVTVIQPQKFPF